MKFPLETACSQMFSDSGEKLLTQVKVNDRPLIFVGPGTGVAAFRSVIQRLKNSPKTVVLIFGCRSADDDFYYAQEWAECAKTMSFVLITAFSRAQPLEGKMYVQHKIKQNSALLSELIVTKNANIYVSGRAKLMPLSVEKAFIEITSAELINQMKKNGRYQQEVW